MKIYLIIYYLPYSFQFLLMILFLIYFIYYYFNWNLFILIYLSFYFSISFGEYIFTFNSVKILVPLSFSLPFPTITLPTSVTSHICIFGFIDFKEWNLKGAFYRLWLLFNSVDNNVISLFMFPSTCCLNSISLGILFVECDVLSYYWLPSNIWWFLLIFNLRFLDSLLCHTIYCNWIQWLMEN